MTRAQTTLTVSNCVMNFQRYKISLSALVEID